MCIRDREQFEKEVGYPFRPEYIIDQGYMNNTYRIPSKEFKDFQAFQRREVAKLAKEMVDIVHEYGKEAMMFMGDHWIGMEPFMDEFASIGLDAVVGSVGNGATPVSYTHLGNSISQPWVEDGATTVNVDQQVMNWIKDSKEWLDAGYLNKTVKGQWLSLIHIFPVSEIYLYTVGKSHNASSAR